MTKARFDDEEKARLESLSVFGTPLGGAIANGTGTNFAVYIFGTGKPATTSALPYYHRLLGFEA